MAEGTCDALRMLEETGLKGRTELRNVWTKALMLWMCCGLVACQKGEPTETTAAKEPTKEAMTTVAQTEETTEAEKEPVRVCVLYENGPEASEEQKACGAYVQQETDEFDVEVEVVGWDWNEGDATAFLEICEAEYDVLIGTSAGFADLIAEYADVYEETRFVVFDALVDRENVQSVRFSQKEGYFLAGVAAALTETESLDGSAENVEANEQSVIGWVNDVDIPVFREWFAAYEQGARYVNPDIQILWDVSGQWEDSESGKTLVSEQMAQGASAVMYVPFDIFAMPSEAMNGNGLYTEGENCLASVRTCPAEVVSATIREIALDTLETGTEKVVSLMDGAVKLELSKLAAEEVHAFCEEMIKKLETGEVLIEEDREETASASDAAVLESLDKENDAY